MLGLIELFLAICWYSPGLPGQVELRELIVVIVAFYPAD